MNWDSIYNIYMIGIGGIGMSALARYFVAQGKHVSGYDRTESELTRQLSHEGMSIYYTEDPAHVIQQDLIIYTPAIPTTHTELTTAKSQKLMCMKRSEVLGEISRAYHSLAIAGTHGKTTTASMLAFLLEKGGLRSTAFLGGIAKNFHSNYYHGESPYVVIEADEYDQSFLALSPYSAIITAMDADHLECYGSEQEMQNAFMKFARRVNPQQPLLVRDSLSSLPWKRAIQTFGIEKGDFYATQIKHNRLQSIFDFVGPGIRIPQIVLNMPGAHNIANMVGAMALGHHMGISAEAMKTAAAEFSGILMRFDVQYQDEQVTYIDDYAHHPMEIDAMLEAVKALFPGYEVLVIFQPHLYSRTQVHYKAFGRVLSRADEVFLLDIYPARENPIPGITSELIAQYVTQPCSLIDKTSLEKQLQASLSDKPSVILTLGAGDIDRVVTQISYWLHHKSVKKN